MIKKYWFFMGMAIMAALAFALPGIGPVIKQYNVLNIGIFLAFLLTGLSLETSTVLDQLKDVKVLAAALFSSLIFFPAAAFYAARFFLSAWPDFVMGALIIGAAPVTVASGTVMTAMAGGNVPLSLFICVLGNFAAIFTIPFMLNLILAVDNAAIDLPILQMLAGLILKVLLPTIIGQLLRPRVKHLLPPHKAKMSIFNQCIVLLIILNAVASSADSILDVGPVLFLVLSFMIGLHVFILVFNYYLARIIGLDLPSIAAFTIHTSQKTLTVSYLVWAGYFAVAYPMALIPAIVYHLTQMIMDTLVAHRFGRVIRRRSS
ncbi:bile acid:sodium symporter [Desulfotignum balticum]|uniref:bile acid:sodium symporter n=1 Tax=Desulfotignum balticum TaxID=115781 RepID=UPI0003F942B5|nr:bile acid:sodium symporter [Desulfotignum balticum]